MQQNLSYVYPQIFLVDRGGSGGPGAPGPETTALPAWPVLPPQLKQGRGGRGGCTALLFTLLLLTMAGLGLGAYYILRLQQELTELRQEALQKNPVKEGLFSSYLAAVVQLQKFDRVSVNVSEPQLVSLEPANTYFGIYKI
ncbi:UNVERIFIED_CONTAM: hypothetical protein FKN15_044792 [Acipenser sinensis]